MAKPIFIVLLPREVNQDQVLHTQRYTQKNIPDYHCLCATHDSNQVDFRVFNADDADDITIENLKKLVIDYLK